jgi:endonuclease/exonuclease/phosphatase family metal-dependent hydrolase
MDDIVDAKIDAYAPRTLENARGTRKSDENSRSVGVTMLLRPLQIHHSDISKSASLRKLSERFGVMCWNVHKRNRPDGVFGDFIAHCRRTYDIALMLFQEAYIEAGVAGGFGYDAAANLAYRNRHYGVLTASYVSSTHTVAWLSHEKELLFTTHKSLLITRYTLADGAELLVVNVHAVNFREDGAFDNELRRLYRYLKTYRGAMIVGGDFNTWNKKRLMRLYRHMRTLNLRRVPFASTAGIKRFGRNPLDHLFYRGLNLIRFDIPDDEGISDHRPLIAIFGT